MPIRFTPARAVFEGHCTVEEAHDLAAWLIAKRGRKVDLAGCTGMHSAVLQCLMALRPVAASAPRDAALAGWLAPLIALPDPASTPPRKSPRRRKPAAAPA